MNLTELTIIPNFILVFVYMILAVGALCRNPRAVWAWLVLILGIILQCVIFQAITGNIQ